MLHGDEKRHVVRQLVAGTRKMLTDENDAKITLSNSSNLKKILRSALGSKIPSPQAALCTLINTSTPPSPFTKKRANNKIKLT